MATPLSDLVLFKPSDKVIKTIVKHFTQSDEFDNEVNAAISEGWALDEVKVTSSENLVMLFALLYKYTERGNTSIQDD